MSNGAPAATSAERSEPPTYENKITYQKCSVCFSIFLLQILAGLTGCKDDGTEFLEKELVQEESTEASGMDAEQKEPKDTESEVSGKESAGAAADISQKKQNESAEEPAPEVEKQLPEISDTPQTIYVDICGAVTSPGVYELPYGSRVFQAIEQAGGYLPEAAASYLNRAKGLSDGQQVMCLPRRRWTASGSQLPRMDRKSQQKTVPKRRADRNPPERIPVKLRLHLPQSRRSI